jgi:hypothetical protein
MIPGSLSSATIDVHVRGLYAVNNLAAGIHSGYIFLSPNPAANYFGSYLPKLGSFFSLYQYTRFNLIKVTYVPTVATTTTGTMAVGFNPDVRAIAVGAGSTATLIGGLHVSCVSDVKGGFTITLPGKMLHETSSMYGPWLTNNAAASYEQQGEGVLQYATENSLAGAAPVGFLQFDVSLTFREFKP